MRPWFDFDPLLLSANWIVGLQSFLNFPLAPKNHLPKQSLRSFLDPRSLKTLRSLNNLIRSRGFAFHASSPSALFQWGLSPWSRNGPRFELSYGEKMVIPVCFHQVMNVCKASLFRAPRDNRHSGVQECFVINPQACASLSAVRVKNSWNFLKNKFRFFFFLRRRFLCGWGIG